ncbi:MFS transporter [Amycolatopsis cihanbeyliensis]|uniref:Transmembrane secretion effector n=1 Tax=Amycolatopsis cihanbeyliensis TaxID=1128664 RepID=A0A542DCG4_AMYCI|nr:MFS transporter [Amycolatopsis cihanbeyliensis]TQJ00759.1 transmembrane secretion effector [Amycolatopsis cihanbeyliensis]
MRGPEVLREPGFARLWLASLCSELAEWMLQAALPVLAYQLTGSATSTAAIMVLGLLPAVVLSPLAGVLADRWDRQVLLRVVCAGQGLAAVPLAVGGADLTVVYLVMAAQAGLAAAFEPVRGALIPELVDARLVTAANGLMGFNGSVARLAGASGGGLLLGFGGMGWLVGGYLAALLVAGLLLIPRFTAGTARPEPSGRRSMLRDWLAGVGMIRRARVLRLTGVALALMSLAQGMFLVLFVLFVLHSLSGGPAEVGVLRGVQAVGGLVAGIAVATLVRRVAPAALLGWATLALGLMSLLIWNGPALTTAFGLYLGLFAVAGAPAVAATSGLLAVVQTAVPSTLTGRVLSAAFAGMAGCTAVGMWAAGALAGRLPLTGLLDVQACLQIVAGLLVLWLVVWRNGGRDRRDGSYGGRRATPVRHQ